MTANHERARQRSSWLLAEFEQLNQYARHNFQLFMAWYAFFVTASVVAVKWSSFEVLESTRAPALYLWLIPAIFVMANLFSVAGCWAGVRYLTRTQARVNELLTQVKTTPEDHSLDPSSPMPLGLYIVVVKLLGGSLLIFIAMWVAILLENLSLSAR